MPQVQSNGLQIEYEIYGPSDAEPLLLISGAGGQITGPSALTDELNRRGFRVIVFDNRDVGLSTRLEDAGVPDMAAVVEAIRSRDGAVATVVPYTIDDMARDAVGVLDGLGITKAHIVGGSMGGMIAHLVAADHQDRTLSLTSISSSSGNPEIPIPPLGGGAEIPLPDERNIDSIVEYWIQTTRVMAGRAIYRTDEGVLRERFARMARRCFYPAGLARQGAAAAAYGDRRPDLRRIKAPTVVVTGAEDPVFTVDFGRDIAANIPGAEFRVIEGMGHDFPDEFAPQLAEAVTTAAKRAGKSH